MKKIMKSLFSSIVVAILLMSGLFVISDATENAEVAEDIRTGVGERSIVLPQTRSFHLGTTPWPYNFTSDAVNDTYDLINAHCDIVTHHFDGGIPWPEAFNDQPYHQNVRDDLDERLAKTGTDKLIYLAVTPINGTRDNLAYYWGHTESLERPGIWKDKTFDDPMVIDAYTNFCLYMINRFDPDYFCYGIEVNILANTNIDVYDEYLVLTERVYHRLKKQHPDLPIFLSLHIDSFYQNKAFQLEAVKMLLPFTDYIAVSTYPFTHT